LVLFFIICSKYLKSIKNLLILFENGNKRQYRHITYPPFFNVTMYKFALFAFAQDFEILAKKGNQQVENQHSLVSEIELKGILKKLE
jgi:hypothetical protein